MTFSTNPHQTVILIIISTVNSNISKLTSRNNLILQAFPSVFKENHVTFYVTPGVQSPICHLKTPVFVASILIKATIADCRRTDRDGIQENLITEHCKCHQQLRFSEPTFRGSNSFAATILSSSKDLYKRCFKITLSMTMA